jgi:hypothetical protein
MACSDEDRGRNRRADAEDRGWSHRVLNGRAIERSSGVVCGLHRARVDEEREFLG